MSNITVTRNQNNSSMSVNNQTTEIAVNRTESLGVTLPWMEKEDKSNKVQTIGPSSTAYQYPSAKAVYEAIQDIPTLEQKQSDWTQTDVSEVDYIKNKPSLAMVATSGSYNDLSDKPTIPVVPTDLSDFNNDVGFITSSDIPTDLSDFNNDVGYITLTDVPEQVNSDWNSNSGKSQILNKPNLATVATSGSYNDLSDKPVIPAAQVQSDWTQSDSSAPDYIKNKPSMPSAQIQSDWNQTNIAEVDYIKNKPNLATVATSGSYNDLSDKPTIPTVPTDLSAFNNDVGYITLTDVPQQQQSDWNQSDNTAVDYIKNKPTIPVVPTNVSSFTNDAGYITLSQVPAQEQSDWNESDSTAVDYIKNKPSLATVATSGDYDDLSNKPTIPVVPTNVSAFTNDVPYATTSQIPVVRIYSISVNGVDQPVAQGNVDITVPDAQIQSDWSQSDSTAVDYIKNKPTIPVVPTNVSSFTNDAGYITSSDIPTDLSDFTNDVGYITLSQVPAQVQSDWNQSDSTSVDFIKNKPTIPVVPTTVSSFTNDAGYITLSDVPAQVQTDWNATTGMASILNKPTLATVATSGSYDDLSDKPSIPAAQVNSDWNSSSGVSQILNKPTLATVATSGSYNDLSNKPTIPVQAQSISSGDTGYVTGDMVYQYIQSLDGSQIAY